MASNGKKKKDFHLTLKPLLRQSTVRLSGLRSLLANLHSRQPQPISNIQDKRKDTIGVFGALPAKIIRRWPGRTHQYSKTKEKEKATAWDQSDDLPAVQAALHPRWQVLVCAGQ